MLPFWLINIQLYLIVDLINYNYAAAEKLLASPRGPVQCNQVYESTPQPKVLERVLSSMDRACHYSGGLQVMHEVFSDYVIMTCIGDNPSSKIFSCLFPGTDQEI